MSKGNILGICSLLVILSFFVLSGALPASAQGGALDGKTFVGKLGEKGKKADKDEFIFKDGTFESKACEKYGFGTAPYTTTASGHTTTFKAETSNDKGDKMKWEGKVTGILISGTTTLYQEGKAPVIYWFKGKTGVEMPKASMPETPKVNTPDMPKADMPESPKAPE
jgi:hypothetical protein